MKKRILSVLLAMVVLAAAPMEASAETIQGSSDWQVTFDGRRMESNFTSVDLDETVYELLPGDTAEITLALRNTGSKASDWYMSNQIISSLEDGSSANGGAYAYVLSYVGADGEETEFYNSETVGGEDANGLHGATDSLEEYFFVDRIPADARGQLSLRITLDGETQGNNYQNTLAQLQMSFAAEEAVSEDEPTTIFREIRNSGTTTRIQTVKTGDNNDMILYISLAALALGLIIIVIVMQRLKREKEEQGGPKV